MMAARLRHPRAWAGLLLAVAVAAAAASATSRPVAGASLRRPWAPTRTLSAAPRPVTWQHGAVRLAVRSAASPAAPPSAAGANGSKPQNDVYLYEPQPLKENEEKHILSVFVADEAGLINRVAGVFARRGANIESLAVALNLDKALFTIVLNGTKRDVSNVCKQIQKLVKVRQVNDVTRSSRIDRELMLIKVQAPAGQARTEVLQIAQVYRARICDMGSDSILMTVVGDPGKLVAIQKMLSRYGILEVARTGRIALLRGNERIMGGGWGDSLRYQKSLASADTESAGFDMSEFELPDRDGDVYAVGDDMGDFVGNNDGLMDITLTVDELLQDGVGNLDSSLKPHMVSIVVADKPGVLNLVTGVFARRGYSVMSLAVGPSVGEGLSRISMVVPGTNASISKLIKQLYKIIYVQEVVDLTSTPHVARELSLIKVACTSQQRRELESVASIFHGSIVDVSPTSVVIQMEGKERKMKALQEVLQQYGILEIARTGRVALERQSGVDSNYLTRYQQGRLM
mmetsp:Transcript_38285/g.99453  ORF Transcript_38285/g.99453 Transcript_38285/m.99453 type:complete len:515 (-) Transcript_38285:228-1772(-)